MVVNDMNEKKDTDTGSSVSEITNFDGTLYFKANDGTHGTELWAY